MWEDKGKKCNNKTATNTMVGKHRRLREHAGETPAQMGWMGVG